MDKSSDNFTNLTSSSPLGRSLSPNLNKITEIESEIASQNRLSIVDKLLNRQLQDKSKLNDIEGLCGWSGMDQVLSMENVHGLEKLQDCIRGKLSDKEEINQASNVRIKKSGISYEIPITASPKRKKRIRTAEYKRIKKPLRLPPLMNKRTLPPLIRDEIIITSEIKRAKQLSHIQEDMLQSYRARATEQEAIERAANNRQILATNLLQVKPTKHKVRVKKRHTLMDINCSSTTKQNSEFPRQVECGDYADGNTINEDTDDHRKCSSPTLPSCRNLDNS